MGVYKCPVCEGRGTVPTNFYNTYGSPTIVNTTEVTCRSCNGKGVIFDSEAFDNMPEIVAKPAVIRPGDLGWTYIDTGSCSSCAHNDGMCYTSHPPQWKCTIENEWHTADHRCDHYSPQSGLYMMPCSGGEIK